jgi:hypothetical protein
MKQLKLRTRRNLDQHNPDIACMKDYLPHAHPSSEGDLQADITKQPYCGEGRANKG